MTGSSRPFALLVGVALAVLGVGIFLSGGVSLPTRQPPRHFHFDGLALFFLGLSPLLAGLLSLAIGRDGVQVESRATQLTIVITLVSLGLAFLLASRA